MVLPLPVILASAMLGAHKVGAAARKSSRAERPQEGEYKLTRTATPAGERGAEASSAPPVAKPEATADIEEAVTMRRSLPHVLAQEPRNRRKTRALDCSEP